MILLESWVISYLHLLLTVAKDFRHESFSLDSAVGNLWFI